MNEGTLGNWVNKYRVKHVDEEPPLSISERAQYWSHNERTVAGVGFEFTTSGL
ncbi:MAG: hypothetical protein V7646_1210 [Pseudonocardia sp.]